MFHASFRLSNFLVHVVLYVTEYVNLFLILHNVHGGFVVHK